MCILCVASRLSRRIVTMLPWLVVPLILIWSFSQLLPPNFRFEVTSPRLACVFVLLVSIGWYEVILPRLSSWQARRSALLREKERVEAQMAAKWRKEAIRRCRNCLTAYKDQNPPNGRFMCTYCGHISRRPVLDMDLAVLGKGIGITENYWRFTRGYGQGAQAKVGSEKCSSDTSYGYLIFLVRILDRITTFLRWVFRKIWGKRPFCDERTLNSNYEDSPSKEHEKLNRTKAEKARRKVEEKRQAKLEKQIQEEEEKKQREEVARLIEEQRRIRKKNSETDTVIEDESGFVRKGQKKEKEAAKKQQMMATNVKDSDSVSAEGKDTDMTENMKAMKAKVPTNMESNKTKSTGRSPRCTTESGQTMKQLKKSSQGYASKEWNLPASTNQVSSAANTSSLPSKFSPYGSKYFHSQSGKLTKSSGFSTGMAGMKYKSTANSVWKGMDSLKVAGTSSGMEMTTLNNYNKCSNGIDKCTIESCLQQPVGLKSLAGPTLMTQPNSWQHLFRRPTASLQMSYSPDPGYYLDGKRTERSSSSLTWQVPPSSSFYSGMLDPIMQPQANQCGSSCIGSITALEPQDALAFDRKQDFVNPTEFNRSRISANSLTGTSVNSFPNPSHSNAPVSLTKGHAESKFQSIGCNVKHSESEMLSKESNANMQHDREDHLPITDVWSLPSLSIECSSIFSNPAFKRTLDTSGFNNWGPFRKSESHHAGGCLSSSENGSPEPISRDSKTLERGDNLWSSDREGRSGSENLDSIDENLLLPDFITKEDVIQHSFSFNSADSNERGQLPDDFCPD